MDYVLDDCLQLVSLLYLTVGRNNEPPAAYVVQRKTVRFLDRLTLISCRYSLILAAQRLLEHLSEAGFYTVKDVTSISGTIDHVHHIIDIGRETYSPVFLEFLDTRLATCSADLEKLRKELKALDPELVPIHETLISILRSTSAVNTRLRVCYSLAFFFEAFSDQKLIHTYLVCRNRSARSSGALEGYRVENEEWGFRGLRWKASCGPR